MIATVNPATGVTVATFEALTESQLEEKLANSAEAYRTYRRTNFAGRAQWLANAAVILEDERDAFGRLMTLEMGKPLEAARQEAAKCALACRYYVEHGERLLADEAVDLGGPRAFIRYQPIGPVLAVMPWNFPFWQVFRFLRAGPDGGQRRAVEALIECSAVRARHRRHRAARGLPGGRVSDTADRRRRRCGA